MKIYFYRPGDDQFWIGCTEEEAENFFLSEMEKGDILHYLYMQRRRKQEPRGARLCAMYRQLYGLKSIKELPEVFFNVSRDLIEMTLGGKLFSQINWDEEGWL